MTSRRVVRLDEGRFAPEHPRCEACRGCGPGPSSVFLPGVSTDRADLVMPRGALVKLLLNSWILPLAAMLVIAITCDICGMNEAWSIALSVAGFVLGITGCRTQSGNLVEVKEVP